MADRAIMLGLGFGGWTFEFEPQQSPTGNATITSTLHGYDADGWKEAIREGRVTCDPDMPVVNYRDMPESFSIARCPMDKHDVAEGTITEFITGATIPIRYDQPYFGAHALDSISTADYIRLLKESGVPVNTITDLMEAN
jgi:hypothetical protein